MQCARCDHENVSEFRFCEMCLAPLESDQVRSDDLIGRFFDEADLLESSPAVSSRGMALPSRYELPWLDEKVGFEPAAREAEVDELVAQIAAAVDAGRGRAVVVRGEVGSGRSQLIASARDRVVSRFPNTRFLVTSAQGTHRPYSLIERLLRLRFDIPDYLGGTIAGERFERAGEALFGDHTGAEVARTCGPMLGFHFWSEHDIDFETRGEQARRASEALTALWLRDLADMPTVVVVDDAGEADEKSVEFIAQLMKDLGNLPAVVLLATDARGLERRPWLAEQNSIVVPQVSDAEMAALARRVLAGVAAVPERAIGILVEAAEGRPGALLAALESLASSGAIRDKGQGWQLDASLLETLIFKGRLRTDRGGRFDELSEDELLVARLGAVFGTRFWLGGVTALLRMSADRARSVDEFGRDGIPNLIVEACAELVDRRLLVRERSSVLPHEACFRFIEEADVAKLHELYDEEELRRLSHRAAVWLDLISHHRSRDLAATLAPLWLAAGEKSHAAHLYLHAGELAFEELRQDEARGYLEMARELAPDTASAVHLYSLLSLGRLAEHDGRNDEAEQLYRDVLGLAWSYRARGQGATALFRLGRLFRTRGRVQQALDHLVPAMKLFEAVGDLKGVASCCDDIGRGYWLAGNMKPALRFLQQAAQHRERLGDRHGVASTLTNMAVLAMSSGQVETARSTLKRAIEIRRQAKEVHGLVESLNVLGIVMMSSGEVEAAVAAMEEAYDLSKRVGNRRLQATLQNNLGEVLLSTGRLEESESLLYKAVEGAGRLDDHNLLSDAARNLALAARQRDDHERALKWSRRSVAAAQLSDVTRVRAAAIGTLGEVLSDADDAEAAGNAFARAAQLWTEANDRGALVACLQSHAAFLVRLGDTAAADRLLVRVDKLQRVPRKRPNSGGVRVTGQQAAVKRDTLTSRSGQDASTPPGTQDNPS